MPPCISNDTVTACKNTSFISSGRSDFQIVDNLPIAVQALPMFMLTFFVKSEKTQFIYFNPEGVISSLKSKPMRPRGVVANVLDCEIVVSEFDLELRNCIPFRTNTLRKGIKLLILPIMS